MNRNGQQRQQAHITPQQCRHMNHLGFTQDRLTAASPPNKATDADVVMAEAEEDNDGFDVVGSLFKVYPKPKPARKHMV